MNTIYHFRVKKKLQHYYITIQYHIILKCKCPLFHFILSSVHLFLYIGIIKASKQTKSLLEKILNEGRGEGWKGEAEKGHKPKAT